MIKSINLINISAVLHGLICVYPDSFFGSTMILSMNSWPNVQYMSPHEVLIRSMALGTFRHARVYIQVKCGHSRLFPLNNVHLLIFSIPNHYTKLFLLCRWHCRNSERFSDLHGAVCYYMTCILFTFCVKSQTFL